MEEQQKKRRRAEEKKKIRSTKRQRTSCKTFDAVDAPLPTSPIRILFNATTVLSLLRYALYTVENLPRPTAETTSYASSGSTSLAPTVFGSVPSNSICSSGERARSDVWSMRLVIFCGWLVWLVAMLSVLLVGFFCFCWGVFVFNSTPWLLGVQKSFRECCCRC